MKRPARDPAIPGLILAAGYSSRMGAFKPLLPLGGACVIATVIASLRQGGVERIQVVTGHRAEEVAAVVEPLGVETVLNPDYASGMFSSIKAGLSALPPRCRGCLLLPVDIPLVRPQTISLLLQAARQQDPDILYPFYAGRRGHPTYLSRRLFDEIAASEDRGGLRSVLARHEAAASTALVADEAILRDMDTPEDYVALQAMAARQCGLDTEGASA